MADLAPHETLELHELISIDCSEIKRLSGNISNIRDADLRNFLQKYLNNKKSNVEAIQKLVDKISQQ